MFSLFRKKKHPQNDIWTEAYDDYIRLVNTGDNKRYLDVDTSIVIEDRDIIQEHISNFSKEQLNGLDVADALFKQKAAASKKEYLRAIQADEEDAEYLQMVLDQLKYPHISSSKWWYHIAD